MVREADAIYEKNILIEIGEESMVAFSVNRASL